MWFKIHGVTSDTGEERSITVEAVSEDDAAARSRELGVLPYTVSELEYEPSLPRVAPKNGSRNETSTINPMALWGWIVLIGGLCVAGFFLILYDTSVLTTGGERVYNTGLQQNRTLGCVAGMIAAAIGAVMVIVDAKTSHDDFKRADP